MQPKHKKFGYPFGQKFQKTPCIWGIFFSNSHPQNFKISASNRREGGVQAEPISLLGLEFKTGLST